MGISSIQRIVSVARKEMLHILRDPSTLFFALVIPVIEMVMLGYAIETNVRNLATVVFDAARTQESRTLLRRFVNSDDFRVIGEVFTDSELTEAMVAGRARVGIKIPENYSREIQAGQSGELLILVDGSESSVAGEALNVGNAIALSESLDRLLEGRPMPVEARPRILFNPDTRAPNFFLPGLLVVLTQMMATMLSANAIVREKEKGTLEQLFLTPVRPGELMLGKLTPYLVLSVAEFCMIALLTRTLFGVPVHGDFLALLAVSVPFFLTMLGLGLWVSTRVQTRDAAMQLSLGTMMPSIFLSGYVFPLDSMPRGFWYLAQAMPTTWMIDASRAVILRGAGHAELWSHNAVMWAMALVSITLSSLMFRKRVT